MQYQYWLNWVYILKIPKYNQWLPRLQLVNNSIIECEILHKGFSHYEFRFHSLIGWLELNTWYLLPLAIQISETLNFLNYVGHLPSSIYCLDSMYYSHLIHYWGAHWSHPNKYRWSHLIAMPPPWVGIQIPGISITQSPPQATQFIHHPHQFGVPYWFYDSIMSMYQLLLPNYIPVCPCQSPCSLPNPMDPYHSISLPPCVLMSPDHCISIPIYNHISSYPKSFLFFMNCILVNGLSFKSILLISAQVSSLVSEL